MEIKLFFFKIRTIVVIITERSKSVRALRRYRIRKIILVEITISRIIAERTINDPTNS